MPITYEEDGLPASIEAIDGAYSIDEFAAYVCGRFRYEHDQTLLHMLNFLNVDPHNRDSVRGVQTLLAVSPFYSYLRLAMLDDNEAMTVGGTILTYGINDVNPGYVRLIL